MPVFYCPRCGGVPIEVGCRAENFFCHECRIIWKIFDIDFWAGAQGYPVSSMVDATPQQLFDALENWLDVQGEEVAP